MRSREIEDYKKGLHLSSIQRSILVGLLLGDGHLEAQNGGKTYRLKVEHSTKQKEYTDWLYEHFKNFVREKPITKEKLLNSKKFTSYYFTTYSLGFFRFYAQQFYVDKKKVIPKIIRKLLDPQALAIWFMDDGSLKSSYHKTYIIHTLGYTREDLLLVQKLLENKFSIKTRIHKQYDKFRLYFLSDTADKFRELIEPYLIPSMKYKLG